MSDHDVQRAMRTIRQHGFCGVDPAELVEFAEAARGAPVEGWGRFTPLDLVRWKRPSDALALLDAGHAPGDLVTVHEVFATEQTRSPEATARALAQFNPDHLVAFVVECWIHYAEVSESYLPDRYPRAAESLARYLYSGDIPALGESPQARLISVAHLSRDPDVLYQQASAECYPANAPTMERVLQSETIDAALLLDRATVLAYRERARHP